MRQPGHFFLPRGRAKVFFRPLWGTLAAVLLASTSLSPVLAQVTADGRTQTNVAGSGATTNVTTQTISQGHGVNSFSSFNVGAGQTVNMHVPQGAAGTVNIINGSQSQINGVVQSMQGGAVGGNLYMANPQGCVVGPQGVVRGGSVSMTTPSQGFVDGMFNSGGVSGSHVGRIIGGTAPLGPGNIEQAHSPDEFVEIEELRSAAAIFCRLVERYALNH